MNEISVGSVVIVSTGQAGTLLEMNGVKSCVLLANGDMWHGHSGQAREPQDQADLDAAPLEYDRFEGR